MTFAKEIEPSHILFSTTASHYSNTTTTILIGNQSTCHLVYSTKCPQAALEFFCLKSLQSDRPCLKHHVLARAGWESGVCLGANAAKRRTAAAACGGNAVGGYKRETICIRREPRCARAPGTLEILLCGTSVMIEWIQSLSEATYSFQSVGVNYRTAICVDLYSMHTYHTFIKTDTLL